MFASTALLALTLAVTNHAGTVLHGEYSRTTMSHLFLRTESGQERGIPYRALPPAERDRVRIAVGAYEPPACVKALQEHYRGELRRIDLLVAGGGMTPEDAARQKAGERAAMTNVLWRLVRERKLSPAAARACAETP